MCATAVDSLTLYAIGNDGTAYFSNDGGNNWQIDKVHENFGVVYEVWDQRNDRFFNYITLDGGESWTQYELPATSSFSKLKFTDYKHGWLGSLIACYINMHRDISTNSASDSIEDGN